jgi:hypothetical protein
MSADLAGLDLCPDLRTGIFFEWYDAEQFVHLGSEYIECSKKGATMPHDEEWRILAEEATQEKDPSKLLEIVTALNLALDEREKQKARTEK